MRIFLAGASGVIGVRLVPLLVETGHTVAGMTRSPGKTKLLEGLGAEPRPEPRPEHRLDSGRIRRHRRRARAAGA